MRPGVRLLALLALVAALAGCDRLPAVGGDGQRCFENGTCKDGFACDEITDICYASIDCEDDDGCPAGSWCGNAACRPCNDDNHCGPDCDSCPVTSDGLVCRQDEIGAWSCGCQSKDECFNWMNCDLSSSRCYSCEADDECGRGCESCAQQRIGTKCVWDNQDGSGEYRCGCDADSDCLNADVCVDKSCVCTPDCTGRCEGGSDGCGGVCPGSCPPGQWCDAGSCVDCTTDPENCGPGCQNCDREPTGHACLDLGADPFCGCQTANDCPDGADCLPDTNRCQVPPPDPLVDLQLDDCSVRSLALSGVHAEHPHPALLVGCYSEWGMRERLWFLDGDLDAAATDESWTHAGEYLAASSVTFFPGSYEIWTAYSDGFWLRRPKNDAIWGGAEAQDDGGNDPAGRLAWSPDGTRLAIGGDEMSMAASTLRDASGLVLATVPSGGMGGANQIAFSVDSRVALYGGWAMDENESSLTAVDTQEPYEQFEIGTGINVQAMAVPLVPSATEELALVTSDYNSGQYRLGVWHDLLSATPSKDFDVQLEGARNAVAFLPAAGGQPAAFVLVGGAAGLIEAYRVVAPGLGKVPAELTAPCGGYVYHMVLSPDGELLATACGSRVHVWEVAGLRAYFTAGR